MSGRKTTQSKPFQVVSLFSGAMGLDLGLIKAGLEITIAQDFDKWCAETIRRNGHSVVLGDLRHLIGKDPQCDFLLDPAGISRNEVFAVVGGPPCQAFSTAGKRLGLQDLRGSLYSQFLKVVDALRPRFFVMENVKGLASMSLDPLDKKSGALLDLILSEFSSLGYKTVHGILDAVHYGTAEFRERLVIVGSRDNEGIFLPKATHFPFHQSPSMRWKTLGEAIGDLEGQNMPCAKFSPRISKYLAMVPEGGNWRSLPKTVVKEAMGGAFESGGGKAGFFRRLTYREPSPTLVTSPIQKATLLCHPRENRPLSVKEYARIQGFPDSWVIEGRVADCYRQIGNAVPTPLGEAIGQMLVAVATGTSEVLVKRYRGTSVHQGLGGLGETR
jgi:DNA (cytosine-5)-methyltransferase 1